MMALVLSRINKQKNYLLYHRDLTVGLSFPYNKVSLCRINGHGLAMSGQVSHLLLLRRVLTNLERAMWLHRSALGDALIASRKVQVKTATL
jgi:hypothetical protein